MLDAMLCPAQLHSPSWSQVVAGGKEVPCPAILVRDALRNDLPQLAVLIELVQDQGQASSRDAQGGVQHMGGDG
eukprot:1161139-Pelagomonas_calceolata.AAC.3